MKKKTALHANTITAAGGTAAILDYYRLSQAPAFKTMQFDRGFFQELRAVRPGIIIVGRIYESNQKLDNDSVKGFINRSVDHARRYPEVDFWEGYNEAFYDTHNSIDKYAAMEVGRVQALANVGAHAAVGCFSCGTPPLPYGTEGNDGGAAWRAFLPAILEAMRHDGVLALHEYDAPWMSRLIRGDHWDPATYGWLCLRYRQVVRYLRELGIRMYDQNTPKGLRIIISESGVDGGVTNRPGPQGGGWADFQDWPDPVLGSYPKQRYWYQWQASQDPYVLLVTSFGECSEDPTWHSFSAIRNTTARDQIIALENGLPEGGQPMTEGVDVSRWQGAINWAKMGPAGARFAWIKASEGTGWRDPRYAENAAGARAAGLLWGPYHYYKNGEPPDAQAAHFAAVAGTGFTLPPALDFEDSGAADPVAMRRFCEAVEERMGRPVIYTGAWWWTRARLGGPQPWASKYPLWAADYDGPVAIPGDWDAWTIHQYTSKGPGGNFGAGSTYIDRNRFNGTIEELAALRLPPGGAIEPVVRQWFDEHQAIFPAPGNALPDAVAAAGCQMYTAEGRVVVGGVTYAVVAGGNPSDLSSESIWVCVEGDWGNVRRIRRRP